VPSYASTSAGTLDTSFGRGGLALSKASFLNWAYAFALQPNHDIVVADDVTPVGTFGWEIGLSTFGPNGRVRTAYGVNGTQWIRQTSGIWEIALAVDSKNRVLVADVEDENSDVYVTRVLPTGDVDSSFAHDGTFYQGGFGFG